MGRTVATSPGPVRLTYAVTELDGGGNAVRTVATAQSPSLLVEANRRPATITFPAPFFGGPVSPPVVRQGNTVQVLANVTGIGGAGASGTAEIWLNGRRIDVQVANTTDDVRRDIPVVNGTIKGNSTCRPTSSRARTR
ncbi:MAG TPA: hypothetical protein VEW93_10050 [Acidimicrobiales bacterium]|nr:hypothetical protein [Acidimicrobiales bacterium]